MPGVLRSPDTFLARTHFQTVAAKVRQMRTNPLCQEHACSRVSQRLRHGEVNIFYERDYLDLSVEADQLSFKHWLLLVLLGLVLGILVMHKSPTAQTCLLL